MAHKLCFTAPLSRVHPSFWTEIYKRKLHDWKSETCTLHIRVTYDTESSSFIFDNRSFNRSTNSSSNDIICSLVVVNTIEEFRAIDKNSLIAQHSSELWKAFCLPNSSHQCDINQFSFETPCIMLCFPNLKRNIFVYWVGYGSFAPRIPFETLQAPAHVPEHFIAAIEKLEGGNRTGAPWLLLKNKRAGAVWQNKYLSDIFSDRSEENERYVVLNDDASLFQERNQYKQFEILLGWRWKNILAYLGCQLNCTSATTGLCVKFIAHRKLGKSILFSLNIQGETSFPEKYPLLPRVLGWEVNPDNGKLVPQQANLSLQMNPQDVAAQAIDLNNSLMKWRVWPELDLDKMKNAKCLILGAGTLGTAVGRCLVGWGFKNILFVDGGIVTHSNPTRQCLFEFQDAGKFKATAAAEAMKRIAPDSIISARGIVLSIPMPGHSSQSNLEDSLSELERLIEGSDVIFSLLDSREARWLPTALCLCHEKLLITAALGFDSYLVMRSGKAVKTIDTDHPYDNIENAGGKLGCYYCTDIIGVTNTLKDRSLDQQCTVSRPGSSYIAAALAVELLVNALQYGDECGNESVPHIIRGNVGSFIQTLHRTEAFDKCICCSASVLMSIKNDKSKNEFLRQVINDIDGSFLTSVSGIDKFTNEISEEDFEM